MKKILLILALLCVSLQAQTYQFESATTASGGITTVTAREKTGWTSNGTTAQDTLATVYRLDKANIRFIVTDADGDTLWFYPQNLFPFVLKDGTTILAAIDSTGRAGFGTSTSGQARRAIFNVLGRAANDTLAIFSNDGGGVVGDSSWVLLPSGAWKADLSGVAPTYFQLGDGCSIQLVDSDRYPRIVSGGGGGILSLYDGGSDEYIFSNITFTIGSGNSITFTSGGTITSTSNGNVQLIPNGSGQTLVGTTVAQAFMTIRASGTSDTTLIVRNDNNATLDSTAMVFANGDGYFGGNNLYLGGHRIRSNAAGDSLIFYDGSTMIFAILSDGSTADLVAGTPLTRRYIPPPDVIWMLRIAIALFLLLIVLKIREHVKLAIRANEI